MKSKDEQLKKLNNRMCRLYLKTGETEGNKVMLNICWELKCLTIADLFAADAKTIRKAARRVRSRLEN